MPRLRDALKHLDVEPGESDLDAPPPDLRASSVQPPSAPPPPTIDDGSCPLCHGARFVQRDVPLGHPDFGRAVACRCTEDEDQEERLTRLRRYSDLGPLTRLTFDNLIRLGRNPELNAQKRFQRCVDDAEAFAKDPKGWLVLVGASGCGKTHIGAAIANRCIETGTPALFVVVPDLLDHLRAAYKPDAEVAYDDLLEQVRNAPVLILDDLGTQSATAWAQEKLFQIMNHRYNARLPTVVTTNMQLSKFDERLRSRLGDPSLPQPHAHPIAKVHILEERRASHYPGLNMLDFPMIRDMTFQTFEPSGQRSERGLEMHDHAQREALRFASEPKGWLVLLGGRAPDRTHLIASIANYRRALGDAPLLVQVEELLDTLRHFVGDDEAAQDEYLIKQTLRTCPLLLLDDLEIGMGSDWVRKELFKLLNPRYMARLPTVITTPNTLNNLLTDGGWERLARLLMGDPGFCSQIVIGESSPEVQPVTQPPRRKPSRRQARD
ncbi:MAG: ATP-binding protein [Dehalococcoidia bacterium]